MGKFSKNHFVSGNKHHQITPFNLNPCINTEKQANGVK